MCYNVPLYFERKNIKISDIFYLTRQNPHTIITFSSGESIATTIPIKELMPLAFCIIELVFDAEGHGVDFVFRYCNDEMAVVEGIPVSEMLNRSFYEVFENGDKKWLVTYADVALNGNKHILQDYSPEIDKTLTIYCFQPASGYCACVLIPS